MRTVYWIIWRAKTKQYEVVKSLNDKPKNGFKNRSMAIDICYQLNLHNRSKGLIQ